LPARSSGWLASLPSGSVAVHITVATDKPQPLIESVRRLAQRLRSELNCPSTESNRTADRLLAQSFAHTTSSDRLVHHHVLDPSTNARRDPEDNQRQHADDSPIVPAVSRDQDCAGLGLDNLADQVARRNGGAPRQLRINRLKAATSASSTVLAGATSISLAGVEAITVWLTRSIRN